MGRGVHRLLGAPPAGDLVMRFLTALIIAIDRLASAIEAYNAGEESRQSIVRTQTEMMLKAQRLNEDAHRSAEAWRETEREHMKVCERRYRALIAGGPRVDDVRH